MTDEEKAEKYSETVETQYFNELTNQCYFELWQIERAYIDGLAEGRKDVTYMKAEEYDEYLNVCRENEQLKKENKLLENTCDSWQENSKDRQRTSP